MPYDDEAIITQRITSQAQKAHTINNKVEIEGVAYAFAEREFPLEFSMALPEDFDTLAPGLARRKYPHEDRPEIIISNQDTTVNFAFDICGKSGEDFSARLKKYKSITKRLHPSNVFYSEKIYTVSKEIKVACYDFRSAALDGDIYSMNFFTDLRDGELLGWFTCPSDLQEKWEPLVRQMIQTIKPLTQDN